MSSAPTSSTLDRGRRIRGECRRDHHVERQRDVRAARLGIGDDLRAVSSRSISTSDLPTPWPSAAMKVLAMPPPTINWSTLPTSEDSSSSLVETLLPATMASSGRAGLASALSSASSSAISNGPPAACFAKRITPCVEACARCAVPKASMTNTSHSAAYFFDRPRRPCPRRRSCGSFPAAPAGRAARPRHPGSPHQRHLDAEQLGQARRDRRQRIGLAPHAFLRTAEVRGDHHRRALSPAPASGSGATR
jgi:hypothetical protein